MLHLRAHPDVGMLRHFRNHGTPGTTTATMMLERLRNALWCRFHYSESQDFAFVREKLEAKTAMGNIIVLPWADVQDLPRL